MKKREAKIAACLLASALAINVIDFSTSATQVNQVLPSAGVGAALEDSATVEDLELAMQDDNAQKLYNGVPVTPAAQAITPAQVDLADGTQGIPLVVAADAAHAVAQENHPEEEAQELQVAADSEETNAIEETGEEGEETEAEAEEGEEAQDGEDDEEDLENLVVAQVTDWINVRKYPTTNSEVLGKLYNNAVGIFIHEEGDGWIRISSGTVTGYVKKEYCAMGEDAIVLMDEIGVKTAMVTAQTLKFRTEPNTNCSVITLLAYGDELQVVDDSTDGWVKVTRNGRTGYVSADYVNISITFVSAESKEEEAARLEAEEQARREAEEQARREAEAAQLAEQQRQQQQQQQQQSQGEATVTTAQGSGAGVDVANFALQYVGNPYVYGGTSLTNGADCSGFVLAVYAHFGVSLPHSATADRNMGTAVASLAEAQPGDLVCYSGHVGIYIGNGQIVHASTKKTGIKISNATYRSIVCIRRIFN